MGDFRFCSLLFQFLKARTSPVQSFSSRKRHVRTHPHNCPDSAHGIPKFTHEGQVRLEQWKAAVRASGIAELIAFVDGLADDAEALANGCSMTWSNGMVEGFVNKVKWIKRSSYGQAGFPLLQRRVLLHPAARELLSKDQRRRSSRQSAAPPYHETSGTGSIPMAIAAA